jgi:hypothetical protein
MWIGVWYGKPPVFFASLFGEIDALFPLAEVENLGIPAVTGSGRIFRIELPSRKFYSQTVEEYLLKRIAGKGKSQT